MVLPKDLKEFIEALNNAHVRYVIVGGYATIHYGYHRSTQDIDIWVERTDENYQAIVKAFLLFGMPLFGMSEKAFLNDDSLDVFTYGRPPACIDLMNRVKGLEFQPVFERSQIVVLDTVQARIISRSDLIQAKKASGRHRDLDDLEHLE